VEAVEEVEAPTEVLVAALAAGGSLTFEPDPEEEEELLPGGRVAEVVGAPAAVEAPAAAAAVETVVTERA